MLNEERLFSPPEALKTKKIRNKQRWRSGESTRLWIQILASTPYVGWVCCWFSPLLRGVYLRALRFSPLLKNPTLPKSNSILNAQTHLNTCLAGKLKITIYQEQVTNLQNPNLDWKTANPLSLRLCEKRRSQSTQTQPETYSWSAHEPADWTGVACWRWLIYTHFTGRLQ